ncbi:YitT family protein [Liquorilactobacillus aquaticus]|uniref:YitT family protein n=1 Tax=Liquorilactobacillus aquaticus TaxID=392566 RepID=UPI000AE10402|nr:YitT family protein [Liquorilactobacillus aquaticus]
MKKFWKNVGLILIGAFIYSFAVNSLLMANHLGEGGVTGLMTILYYWLNVSPALTNIICNGVLLLVGWKLLDKRTIAYTVVAVTGISAFLKMTATWGLKLEEPIVGALFGGMLMGIALGFIMYGEGTIAGSTILAKIINRYLGIKTGTAMLFFDLIVAVPSFLLIGIENMLLTIIELYVSAAVLNQLLAIFGKRKALTIISKKHELIAKKIAEITQKGVTLIPGQGVVSGDPQMMVYCICEQKQLVKIMAAVRAVDEHAFVVMEEVHSVYGKDSLRIL